MPCEDAPCCGCCGPNGDDSDQWHEQDMSECDGDTDDTGCYDMSDVDADADTLKSAGYGTNEDYGGFDDGGDFWYD